MHPSHSVQDLELKSVKKNSRRRILPPAALARSYSAVRICSVFRLMS